MKTFSGGKKWCRCGKKWCRCGERNSLDCFSRFHQNWEMPTRYRVKELECGQVNLFTLVSLKNERKNHTGHLLEVRRSSALLQHLDRMPNERQTERNKKKKKKKNSKNRCISNIYHRIYFQLTGECQQWKKAKPTNERNKCHWRARARDRPPFRTWKAWNCTFAHSDLLAEPPSFSYIRLVKHNKFVCFAALGSFSVESNEGRMLQLLRVRKSVLGNRRVLCSVWGAPCYYRIAARISTSFVKSQSKQLHLIWDKISIFGLNDRRLKLILFQIFLIIFSREARLVCVSEKEFSIGDGRQRPPARQPPPSRYSLPTFHLLMLCPFEPNIIFFVSISALKCCFHYPCDVRCQWEWWFFSYSFDIKVVCRMCRYPENVIKSSARNDSTSILIVLITDLVIS